jgi:DNA-binding response OmpR family regulator
MLTARDAVEARIAALDSGADDYLTKPFDFGELLARLRAVIRRGRRPLTPSRLRVGPLELDTRARCALRHGAPLVLTAREYALLEHLVLHADAVISRAAIAEHVWDAPYETMSNVIDVLIQRLRRKIDDPGRPSLIVTRRDEGYMLSAAVSASAH